MKKQSHKPAGIAGLARTTLLACAENHRKLKSEVFSVLVFAFSYSRLLILSIVS